MKAWCLGMDAQAKKPTPWPIRKPRCDGYAAGCQEAALEKKLMFWYIRVTDTRRMNKALSFVFSRKQRAGFPRRHFSLRSRQNILLNISWNTSILMCDSFINACRTHSGKFFRSFKIKSVLFPFHPAKISLLSLFHQLFPFKPIRISF